MRLLEASEDNQILGIATVLGNIVLVASELL